MSSGTRFFITLFALAACWLAATQFSVAQPKGWPCDYGYRPGTIWFYRSLGPPYQTYTVTVLRDSIGGDGKYWTFAGGNWYRIDSTCTFDAFSNPKWETLAQRTFIATADSGDRWVMDSVAGQPSYRAIVYDTYDQYVFGKKSRTSEVRYYFDNPDNWFGGDTWASGVGIIARRSNPGVYDVLIGAIIDGKHYGTTSGMERNDDPRMFERAGSTRPMLSMEIRP